MKILFLFFSIQMALAASPLEDLSKKTNSSLPEVYDPVTKLMRTSVENNHFVYHFLVDATPDEFYKAFPMVKSQIQKTICSLRRERAILQEHRANIVYRYENVKGQSLGEFMIPSDRCGLIKNKKY